MSAQIVLMFMGTLSFWGVYEAIYGELTKDNPWGVALVFASFATGIFFAFQGTHILIKLIDFISGIARRQ